MPEDLENALRSFELSSGVVHPVVRETLTQPEVGAFRIPFLISHGTYLFGCLFAPTSAKDGRPDLMRVSCLVSLDSTLFFVNCEAPSSSVPESFGLKLRATVGAAESSGAKVLAAFETVLNELKFHLESIESDLATASDGIQRSAKMTSKRAATELALSQAKLRVASGELLNIEPIVEAMTSISRSVSEDQLDLTYVKERELFERSLEIQSRHLSEKSNQLFAAYRGASRLLAELQIGFGAQMSELRIKGNHFLVALATLLLTPVILLNVYSQFLAEGQSWSNEFTASYFWVVVVGVASIQGAFFRVRKWLR